MRTPNQTIKMTQFEMGTYYIVTPWRKFDWKCKNKSLFSRYSFSMCAQYACVTILDLNLNTNRLNLHIQISPTCICEDTGVNPAPPPPTISCCTQEKGEFLHLKQCIYTWSNNPVRGYFSPNCQSFFCGQSEDFRIIFLRRHSTPSFNFCLNRVNFTLQCWNF